MVINWIRLSIMRQIISKQEYVGGKEMHENWCVTMSRNAGITQNSRAAQNL